VCTLVALLSSVDGMDGWRHARIYTYTNEIHWLSIQEREIELGSACNGIEGRWDKKEF